MTMFHKIKFNRNSLPAVIAAIVCAVCLMVSVTCSLEGSIESLRLKATNNCKHIWGEYTRTTAPTCTEKGEETSYCENDPAHIDTKPVNALGHSYRVVSTTATCINDGIRTDICRRCSITRETREGALGHEYEWVVIVQATTTSTGMERYTCVRCGFVGETRSIPKK
jgi:hypothetical protein